MFAISPFARLPFASLATLAMMVALSGPLNAQQGTGTAGDTITGHGISVYGDLKLPADFKNLPYVNPDAPKGGELRQSIPNSSSFDNYNPYTFRGRPEVLSSVMLETLLTATADEVGAAYCLLCKTIQYPENRDWVIFNLRPEARFSDGTPLTADDVLFSFQQLRDKGLSSLRVVMNQIVESAEVIDPQTIRFNFKPGYPRRDVIQSVGGLPVFSKADFEKNKRDLEMSSNIPFVGSGPYVFEKADIGRSSTYRRNPDYWGKDLPINVGRFNFDRIGIEYFADYEAAFEAFKAGEYTFRREVSSISWATGYDFPALKNGWVVKTALPDGNPANGQSWMFNLRRPDFQDVRVRQAIGLMFNFEWSNDSLFYGLYTRVNSFWENSDLAASGPTPPEERAVLEPVAADLPPGVLTDEPAMASRSGPRQLDRGNLRAASALLDEAGWKTGADGLRRNAEGRVLKLEILNDSQSFDRVLNPYIANLRALGVDARNVRVDNSEYESRQRDKNFDMIGGHLPPDLIPGASLQQYFGSANVNDVFNIMGLANPGVDKLIAQVEAAPTRDEMTTRVRALDRALRALRFWVPQWYNDKNLVAYWDQYGRPATLPPYALGELDFWWFDADKAAKLKQAGALR